MFCAKFPIESTWWSSKMIGAGNLYRGGAAMARSRAIAQNFGDFTDEMPVVFLSSVIIS
jgi:hypothetical protein